MATEFGYTGKILRVDLSSGSITDFPTINYADRFLGGRGIADKLYWDEVSPDTKAFDPENRLLFITGPFVGIPGFTGSRMYVCGKSAVTTPEQFCWGNLGGGWAAYLKFAGYDGIVVQGKSDKPVYLFLHDGICEIRDASYLWGKDAFKVREKLKDELGSATRVVVNAPAGDNMVPIAVLKADDDSCAAGGLAAVMGSKRLKAIAVSGGGKVAVANPEKLQELIKYIHRLKVGPKTGPRKPPPNPKMKWVVCWGCDGCTHRTAYKAENEQEYRKFHCDPFIFYREWAHKYYRESNEVPFWAAKLCDDYGLDTEAIGAILTCLSRWAEAGILTDESTGIPVSKIGSLEFMETLVKKISLRDGFGDILAEGLPRAADLVGGGAKELIADCNFKAGHLNDDIIGLIYITWALFDAMAPTTTMEKTKENREILGLMVHWLEWLGNKEGEDLSTTYSHVYSASKEEYFSIDVFRSIARKFWGSELAADFSTFEGKALAATRMQNRMHVNECLNLCHRISPILSVKYSGDHIGDSTIPSKLFSAVTGKELDEDGLDRVGERVFNLHRAIYVREGHQGRESDTLPESWYMKPLEDVGYAGTSGLTPSQRGVSNPEGMVPGKDGQVISKKDMVFDREKFEKLKDEYYELRGWDVATGLQTVAKLKELGLGDIGEDLKRRGLAL